MKTEMPTELEVGAFKRGEEAYKRGSEKDANPHWDNYNLQDFWSLGWESAKADAEKAWKIKML